MKLDSIITPEGGQLSLAARAKAIEAEHAAAARAGESMLEHGRRCGDHLSAVKDDLGHGEFLPWVAANCTVSERQARRYMRIARNWEHILKTASGSDLSIKHALRLVQPKDEPAAEASSTETLSEPSLDPQPPQGKREAPVPNAPVVPRHAAAEAGQQVFDDEADTTEEQDADDEREDDHDDESGAESGEEHGEESDAGTEKVSSEVTDTSTLPDEVGVHTLTPEEREHVKAEVEKLGTGLKTAISRVKRLQGLVGKVKTLEILAHLLSDAQKIVAKHGSGWRVKPRRAPRKEVNTNERMATAEVLMAARKSKPR